MPFSFTSVSPHNSPGNLRFEEYEESENEFMNIDAHCIDEMFFDRKRYFFMIKVRSVQPTVVQRELPPGVYALHIKNDSKKSSSLHVRIIGHARQNYPPFNSSTESIAPQKPLKSRFQVGHNMPHASLELKLNSSRLHKKWWRHHKIKCTIVLEKVAAVLDNDYRNQPNALEIPPEFNDPITKDIMETPVVASDGHTYEKSSIEQWIQMGQTISPLTNEPLDSDILVPNYNLRSQIEAYQYRILKHEEKQWDDQEQQEARQKEERLREERMRSAIANRERRNEPSYDVLEEIIEYVDEYNNDNDNSDNNNNDNDINDNNVDNNYRNDNEIDYNHCNNDYEFEEESENSSINEEQYNTLESFSNRQTIEQKEIQQENSKKEPEPEQEQNQQLIDNQKGEREIHSIEIIPNSCSEYENNSVDEEKCYNGYNSNDDEKEDDENNSDNYDEEEEEEDEEEDVDTVLIDSDGSFQDIESEDEIEEEEKRCYPSNYYTGSPTMEYDQQYNDGYGIQNSVIHPKQEHQEMEHTGNEKSDLDGKKSPKEHNVNSPSRGIHARLSEREKLDHVVPNSSPVLLRNWHSFDELQNLTAINYASLLPSSPHRQNNTRVL